MRVVWIVLSLGLLAAGAYLGWLRFQPATAGEEGAVTAVAVEAGDIEETVTAQGKVEAKHFVDVGVQVSGQLKRLLVELGDEVKSGELIAEIDPRVYAARVAATTAERDTLKAQLAEQEAEIELARQLLERTRRLIESDAVSREELQNREAGLKVALARAAALRAQIEQVQSTLSGDVTNLGFTRIYAPMDGTVVVQSAREGQTLNANQQAPLVVQVANLDEMTVRAQVAEADVTRITPGGRVYFTTLGGKGRRWEGKVRQVLPTPEVINDVVLYNALVDVDNRDRQLLAGMTTQMFFVLAEASQVPLIPVKALRERQVEADKPPAEAWQVRVQKPDGSSELRTVQIGLKTRTRAEVRSGLSLGDQVQLPLPVSAAGGQFRFPGRI
jgi:membrane fusion protein, macrolide-specific efflux system